MGKKRKKMQNDLEVNQASEDFYKAEEKKFYEFLKDKPATASFVSKETQIAHKNLTRYKRNLEKKGLLKEVKLVKCSVTRRIAWEITTNTTLFPNISQLSLFDND